MLEIDCRFVFDSSLGVHHHHHESSSVLQESIVVTEIHSFGAAYKDGRLRKGDLVLAVNDISFREITKKDGVRVLKESPSPLKLIVLRENPQILFTTSQRKCSKVLRKQRILLLGSISRRQIFEASKAGAIILFWPRLMRFFRNQYSLPFRQP